MPRSIGGVERRNTEIGEHFAVCDQVRDAALEGIVFTGDRRIVLELVADEFGEEFVVLDLLHEVKAVFQLGDVAAGMGEDNFLELLIGLGIADQARERRDAGAGREHVEALAGGERVEHQRAGRLLAHQDLVTRLDALQVLGERTVRHLDREEFEFFIPGRACDRVGAVDRLSLDHQADHGEFARTETEAGRSRHAEAEEMVSVMRDAQHRLGEYAFGYDQFGIVGLHRSIHRLSVLSFCRLGRAYNRDRPIPQFSRHADFAAEISIKAKAASLTEVNSPPLHSDFYKSQAPVVPRRRQLKPPAASESRAVGW